MATYRKHKAQEWAWETLKGQWTTLITPFTPDNRFDREGMKRNIRHVRSLGTVGGRLHLGHGRVLEPDPRGAAGRDGRRG